MITKAKDDTTHNRRVVFSYLQDKEGIKALFGEVIEKVGTRPGGYTRIIKTGYRLGDNAEMCIIELVDFNELMLKDAKPAKKTTRRSRRSLAILPLQQKLLRYKQKLQKPRSRKPEDEKSAE